MFIHVNYYLAKPQSRLYGPRGPRRSTLVPMTESRCDCVSPRVACETDGTGQVLEWCLKCGCVSLVNQRSGTPLTNKRRAAELKMFARESKAG